MQRHITPNQPGKEKGGALPRPELVRMATAFQRHCEAPLGAEAIQARGVASGIASRREERRSQ
jgi:hypothetical protein